MHSFDTVDNKLAEAEFFLQCIADCGTDMFALQCYLSAYLSASRTSTLALQQFKELPGFADWYEPHRARLKENPLARFILDARNSHIHGGPYPIAGGRFSGGKAEYYFADASGRHAEGVADVLTACREHFVTLLDIVYDCYLALGIQIDSHQHFTKEHFATIGKTIEDAELEIWGFVRTSLIDDGFDDDARWHELRGRMDGTSINHLFFSYLGRATPPPLEPEEYSDFDYTPEEKGWLHTPAGFASVEEYWSAVGITPAK